MEWLAERGYGEVTEVESAQEHLLFALPPELRRDLRTAGIAESPEHSAPASGARAGRTAAAS